MSFTYTQLKTAIKDFTENTESSFVAHLSDFIKAAEQRIFTTVDLEFFRKNATGTLTSGNQFLQMPTDFLAAFSLDITSSGSKIFLMQKDVNFLQEAYPDNTVTGTPKYYAVYDYQNFILAPVPNTNFSSELHYYHRPDSLTVSKFNLTLSSVSGTFQGETITGGSSGATTTVTDVSNTPTLEVIIPSTDFSVGETVTGATSGATGTVVSTSADNTLTYLSENAPNSMLYGSLMEAYTFMKGEKDVMDLYNGRFIESLGRIKDLAEARENTDAYRTGLPSRART